MFFMLVIFFLEVIFSFLPAFVGDLTALISKYACKISDDEMNTRAEIKDLKEQQSGLSATDNFAQYARLQRKIDKLLSIMKEKGNARKQSITYVRMGVSAGIYILHAVIMLSLMFFLRREPLLVVNASWFSPVGKIISFPTGIPGAVGLGCWVLVSNSVVQRVKKIAGF